MKKHRNRKELEISTLAPLEKLFSPSGCAKTTKAIINNIDVEINESIRRENKFNEILGKEYKKLSCHMEVYSKSNKKIISPSPKSNLYISFEPLSNAKIKERSASSAWAKKKIRNGIENKSLEGNEKVGNFSNFISAIKKGQSLSPIQNKAKIFDESRLRTVNNVIEKCKKTRGSFVKKFENGMMYLKKESNDINNYLTDLIDCVKFSKNEDMFKNAMSNRKHIERINYNLKKDLVSIHAIQKNTIGYVLSGGKARPAKSLPHL